MQVYTRQLIQAMFNKTYNKYKIKKNNFNNFLQKTKLTQSIRQRIKQRIRIRQIYSETKTEYKFQVRIMSLQTMGQAQDQNRTMKVQQKIRLLVKNKKLQRLASQKDSISEKPISIYNGKLNRISDQQSSNQREYNKLIENNFRSQQTFQNAYSKKLKSTIAQQFKPSSSINLKQSVKRFNVTNKNKTVLIGNELLTKTPSFERLQNIHPINRQSQAKLKRPSSVMQKSIRNIASRTRTQKPLQPQDQKIMQQKIRHQISDSFEYGVKLQKFAEQRSINLLAQKKSLFSEQINILRLISNCKKYFYLNIQNLEQQQIKLSTGIQQQVIQMLKKKNQKEKAISKCENITNQIQKLIQKRLAELNKAKVS